MDININIDLVAIESLLFMLCKINGRSIIFSGNFMRFIKNILGAPLQKISFINVSDTSYFRVVPKFPLKYMLEFLDEESLHQVKITNKFFYKFISEYFCYDILEKQKIDKLEQETFSASLCKHYKRYYGVFAEKLNIKGSINIFLLKKIVLAKYKNINMEHNLLLTEVFDRIINNRYQKKDASPIIHENKFGEISKIGLEQIEEKRLQILLEIGAKFNYPKVTNNAWQRCYENSESIFGDFIDDALNSLCSKKTIELLVKQHPFCMIKGYHVISAINHPIYKYPEELILFIFNEINRESLSENIFFINLPLALIKNYSDECLLSIFEQLPLDQVVEGVKEAINQKRSEKLLLKLISKLFFISEGYIEHIKLALIHDYSDQVLYELISLSGKLHIDLVDLANQKNRSSDLIMNLKSKKNGCLIF